MIADVIVDSAASETDRIYSYLCDDTVAEGSRVYAPFGGRVTAGFVDFVFQGESGFREKRVVALRTGRVCLAIEFLHEKIQFSAHHFFFADGAKLRDVRTKSCEFFVDIAFIGEHGDFG